MLQMTLDSALVGPYLGLGAVWLEVAPLGSMTQEKLLNASKASMHLGGGLLADVDHMLKWLSP